MKIKTKDSAGNLRDVLLIKGAGCDLATVNPENFTALKLSSFKELRHLGDSS